MEEKDAFTVRTFPRHFNLLKCTCNLAVGAGQILLLAGQFWPAGLLLPITAVYDHIIEIS